MKLLSIQTALFSEELIGRPDLLMTEVNSKLGSVFDAMPNIINLPPVVPADIPIVQTKSTNEIYALNVSRNRIDLIISPPYERENTPSEFFKEYKPVIEKYSKAVLNSINLIRIGVILTLFQDSDDNTKTIYDKYLSVPYSTNCVEINLRMNKQNLHKGIVYNNIAIVEAGELNVGDIAHKGIIIQLDTNNAPETDKRINYEIVSTALTQVAGKIKPMALKELI